MTVEDTYEVTAWALIGEVWVTDPGYGGGSS